ncbi:MAG: acyl-CoA dehydrogenase family protein [candidate division Zixibacteria bacterium]|nr:acyl-CoA dehydrogenase family protein [candidate division Zixibacteria bacterium]
MDFELGEDQKLMAEAAREFAEKKLMPIAEKMDEEEKVPQEIYAELAELGYFGMLLPEKYGGLELDTLSYACAMEELARGSAAVMVGLSVHDSLCCRALYEFGSDYLKDKYLEKMASGEYIGAYCLTEPNSGTDAGSLKTTAVETDDGYVLNGSKSFITSAGFAKVFIAFVLTDKEAGSKGISCFIIDAGTDGLNIGAKERKMGLKASDTREVSFIDCKVPKENLIGEKNKGFKIALSLLDNGRVGIAAQAIGIAQAAYEEAYKYAHEREQFGRPIANFQAIQFKLSDMALKIEASRLLIHKAAVMKDKGRASKYCSMAKLSASETANFVANQAVQIHGGYGYVKEYAVERYFRDARVTEIYEGTSEVQRMVIYRNLGKKGQ